MCRLPPGTCSTLITDNIKEENMTRKLIAKSINAAVLLTLLVVTLAVPAKVSASTYYFEPDANYTQSDVRARIVIYPGGSGINPAKVDWITPGGSTQSYCITGGCGNMYDKEVSDNGTLVWIAFNFYIAGQSRTSGTYTAVVYNYNGYYTELFRANFYIEDEPILVTKTFRSAAAQDGWTLESAENSSTGGSFDTTAPSLRVGDDAANKQYRAVLSFNTSSLPDTAVITKATLNLKKVRVVGGGDPAAIFEGIRLDIRKGYFGGAAGLAAGDFQAAASKVYGPYITIPFDGWYSFSITSGKDYINKLTTNGGLTQIRMRFSLDDNNNSSANYLILYSGSATATADRPQLVIEYYIP